MKGLEGFLVCVTKFIKRFVPFKDFLDNSEEVEDEFILVFERVSIEVDDV